MSQIGRTFKVDPLTRVITISEHEIGFVYYRTAY